MAQALLILVILLGLEFAVCLELQPDNNDVGLSTLKTSRSTIGLPPVRYATMISALGRIRPSLQPVSAVRGSAAMSL